MVMNDDYVSVIIFYFLSYVYIYIVIKAKKRIKLISILKYMRASLEIDDDGKNNIIYVE